MPDAKYAPLPVLARLFPGDMADWTRSSLDGGGFALEMFYNGTDLFITNDTSMALRYDFTNQIWVDISTTVSMPPDIGYPGINGGTAYSCVKGPGLNDPLFLTNSGNGMIFTSTNNGASWTACKNFPYFGASTSSQFLPDLLTSETYRYYGPKGCVNSANPNTFYTGYSSVGIFVTMDAGVSWTPLSSASPVPIPGPVPLPATGASKYQPALFYNIGNNIFIFTYQGITGNPCLYKNLGGHPVNGFVPFNMTGGPALPFGCSCIYPGPTNTLYFVYYQVNPNATGSPYAKTTFPGAAIWNYNYITDVWTACSPLSSNTSSQFCSLAYEPVNNILAVCDTGGNGQYSYDGGVTWSLIQIRAPVVGGDVPWLRVGTLPPFGSLPPGPSANMNTGQMIFIGTDLIMAGGNGCYKVPVPATQPSPYSGVFGWTPFALGIKQLTPTTLVSGGGNIYAAHDDFGMFKVPVSNPAAAPPHSLVVPHAFQPVQCVDLNPKYPNTIAIVGEPAYAGGVETSGVSIDNGVTWRRFIEIVNMPSVAASGTFTFTLNPTVNTVIGINGVNITFVTGTPVGNQSQIGANLSATLASLLISLQTSANGSIAACHYILQGNVLTVVSNVVGGVWNVIKISSTVAGVTVSGSTLSGGNDGLTRSIETHAGGGGIAVSTPTNYCWWVRGTPVASRTAVTDYRPPSYTLDGGFSWNTCNFHSVNNWADFSLTETAGYDGQSWLVADKVNDGTFYFHYPFSAGQAPLNPASGFHVSTDGGVNFTQVSNAIPQEPGKPATRVGTHSVIKAVPGHAGHVFFVQAFVSAYFFDLAVDVTTSPLSGGGLSVSTLMRSFDGCRTWKTIPNVLGIVDVAFGATASPDITDYPAIFIIGWVKHLLTDTTTKNYTYGVHVSHDNGMTWKQLALSPQGYATNPEQLQADPDIPGRAYYIGGGQPFCFYNKRQVNTWDKQSQYAMQSWYNSSM